MKHELKRAQIQRFIALQNAFKTIDAFAIPSLTPEESKKYDSIKESLLSNYSKGITLKYTKEYHL